jgi:hypothetical protein
MLYRRNNAFTLLKIKDRDIYGKQAAQLTFTTFSPLQPGLSKISYYIEEKNKKLYLFKKILSPYNTGETEGFDIIEDLESFTIEALYNNKWIKTWDSDINKGIPDEIRISLSFMAQGKVVTVFDVSQPKVEKTLNT